MTQEELNNLAQESAQQFWADAANYGIDRDLGLNADSVTVDVGGYLGAWTAYVTGRYNCTAWVFEPVREYFDHLVRRFESNPKVRIFHFGLEDRNYAAPIANMAESSSMFYPTRHDAEEVRICDAHPALRDLERVDLLMLNGEGCEYRVLPRLAETDLLRRVRNILVQFHTFYPNAESERLRVRGVLNTNHQERWCYPFTWEHWSRR